MNPISRLRFWLLRPVPIIAAVFMATSTCMGLGSWTNVINAAPGSVELMLLLSDGTVKIASGSRQVTEFQGDPSG